MKSKMQYAKHYVHILRDFFLSIWLNTCQPDILYLIVDSFDTTPVWQSQSISSSTSLHRPVALRDPVAATQLLVSGSSKLVAVFFLRRKRRPEWGAPPNSFGRIVVQSI